MTWATVSTTRSRPPEAHAEAFDRQLERAGAASAGAPGGGGLPAVADAVFAVQSAFEERFGRIVGCPFGNLAAELSTTDDEVRAHVAAVFARWEAVLAEICGTDRALRPGLSPEQVARAVVAQMQGLILLAKARGGSARSIRDDLGVDPGLLDTAIADPTTHDEVRAEHRKVVAHGGYGVPTLFVSGPGIEGEQCLFGPVLVDPPAGAAAERLWHVVVGMTEFPREVRA